jgi:hypothetical protein
MWSPELNLFIFFKDTNWTILDQRNNSAKFVLFASGFSKIIYVFVFCNDPASSYTAWMEDERWIEFYPVSQPRLLYM